MFEYSAEKFETGIRSIDQFEEIYGPQTVIQVQGGVAGFAPGDKIKQTINNGIEVFGEVAQFIQTQASVGAIVPRQADLYVTGIYVSDGSLSTFSTTSNTVIERIESELGDDWSVIKVYGINDDELFIPQEPLSQNTYFENSGDDIIDFSEKNPFGEP